MPNADYHRNWTGDAEHELRRLVRERDEQIAVLRSENRRLRAELRKPTPRLLKAQAGRG